MPLDELMAGEIAPTTIDNREFTTAHNSRLRPPSSCWSSLDKPLLIAAGSANKCDASSHNGTLAILPAPSGTSTALVVASSAAAVAAAPAASFVLHRMTHALQQQNRPAQMTADEKFLWDAVQALLCQNNSNNCNAAATCISSSSGSYWEHKYEQREAEWIEQQKEHDRALRAIQRVLADVTTERDQTILKLQEELEQSHEQRDDTIWKLTQKLKEMQQEMNKLKEKDGDADKDVVGNNNNIDDASPKLFEILKQQLQKLKESNVSLQEQLQQQPSQKKNTEDQDENGPDKTTSLLDLQQDNEQKAKHIQELKELLQTLQSENEHTRDSEKNNEADEGLRKEMEEKAKSLENARMIIMSLENANGSLARELRAKLKEKEEELANLTSTSAERKRTLESLATELRGLQRQQQKPRLSQKQMATQKALCQLLERNVKALRQAAVQHEARNDQSSVDQISQIVSETFTSLKHNLESWETYLRSTELSDQQEVYIVGNDPHIEACLVAKEEESNALRKELEQAKTESRNAVARLQREVQGLKEQLASNMELLAKKGRELTVLRDSLNLDDNGVGYISDDGTDGEEAETEEVKSSISSCTGSLVRGGPSVGSRNPSAAEMSDATAAEIQMLKNEIIGLQKEQEAKTADLKSEKESLANAKMIISSLEKANKSMLEDLRSRLQDSNTAIASLLEKSMEHEKTIESLRMELEAVKEEREKEEQESKAQVAKLRDESLVFSMRLAAKDREVEELQSSLAQYEGPEVPITKVRMSSVEEKKDDPASDNEVP